MRRPFVSLLAAVALIAVTGGAALLPTRWLAAPEPRSAEPAGDRLPADLVGRTFVSELVTQDGEVRPLVDDTRIRLEFVESVDDAQNVENADDAQNVENAEDAENAGKDAIIASAGCNTMRGRAVAESDRLLVSELVVTEMGCEPRALHDQDEWLADVLRSGPTYKLEGTGLTLQAAATVIELIDSRDSDGGSDGVPDNGNERDGDEPVSSNPSLPGTTWRLIGLIEGDSVRSVPGDVAATIAFESDSIGFSIEDCNTGGADAEITESEIAVDQLIMTMIFCEESANEAQAAIQAVLDGEIGYAIEGDTLTLTHPSGGGLSLSR